MNTEPHRTSRKKVAFTVRDACPACGHSACSEYRNDAYSAAPVSDFLWKYYDLKKFMTRDDFAAAFSDMRYILAECKACKTLFQRHVASPELLAELYGQWIPGDRLTLAGSVHYMSEALRIVALLLRRKADGSVPSELDVLDYGMGQGGFARALVGCGCNVYGYDFADDRQEKARAFGVRSLSVSEIANLRFDYINTEQVLEHVSDPLGTVRMLSASLKPGGVLKIAVPFNRWLEKGDREINWSAGPNERHAVMPLHPLEHLQYYRRESIINLAQSASLKRIRANVHDELNYSLAWFKPIDAAKNLGRAFVFDRFRHYYLFEKAA
jgi:SAM-dependent methyltransferase